MSPQKRSIILPIYKGDKTVAISEAHHCFEPHTKSYPTFFPQDQLQWHTKLLGAITVGKHKIP